MLNGLRGSFWGDDSVLESGYYNVLSVLNTLIIYFKWLI